MKAITKSMAGLGSLLATAALQPALAHADQDDHRGGGEHEHHGNRGVEHPSKGHHGEQEHWRGGDYRSGGFQAHGDKDWRRGHWERREHGGRFGWWWVVGSTLYPFGYPVYPYPAGPTGGGYAVYYCPSLQAYFPDVSSCPLGWELVSPGR